MEIWLFFSGSALYAISLGSSENLASDIHLPSNKACCHTYGGASSSAHQKKATLTTLSKSLTATIKIKGGSCSLHSLTQVSKSISKIYGWIPLTNC